ncbi:hypothetical protein J132_06205 [Termitomyces sp. J132]|nr:hypothetical protein J132_06205 [Termitomyces sp. J132]
MALATVVGGFGIASTVGTYAGVVQNHLGKNNNQVCQITASLSNTKSNLILAFEVIGEFADILAEGECNNLKNQCNHVTKELMKYQKTPIPKKKKFFRQTQQYKDHLSEVKELETTASDLLVEVKQTSSNAAIKMAKLKRAEQTNREAREARRDFLEDIHFWTTIKQLDRSIIPDLSAIRIPNIMVQEPTPSTSKRDLS